MDINAIKVGIWNQYNGNGTLTTALAGGLHWLKGRQRPTVAQYPNAVYFEVTGNEVLTFAERSEDMLFQFSIFDRDTEDPTNATTIDATYTALVNCFDLCTLTVSGYDHTVMIRGMDHEMQTEDDTLQHTVDYRVRVQKSR